MPVVKRDVTSLSKDGSAKLKGDVTLSEGSGISLTQSGQDIEIASTGVGSGDVVGPASSIASEVALFFDGTGKEIVGNGGHVVYIPAQTTLRFTNGLVNGGTMRMNAGELILDSDEDTSITADTDDQVDFKISGADDFRMTANVFTALSGSKFATDTIDEATGAAGVTIDGVVIKDGEVDGVDLGAITATETELNYTDGVTSAIQTQLDAKQPLDADLSTIAGLAATTDNFIQAKSSAWASRTPAQVAADLAVEIGKLLYPVNTVVTFGVSTNPATLLGFGTWAAIAGRVIVGFDSGQTEFDTLDETGGAKTVTLTSAQSGVPAHTHSITDAGHSHNIVTRDIQAGTTSPANTGTTSTQRNRSTDSATTGITIDNNTPADAASAHNNLQPYIVKYVWQRTA